MSSISSNLYEGNGPTTFHVLKYWIIFKKNLFNEWNLSGEVFVGSKFKDTIGEEKMENTKARNEMKYMLKFSLLNEENINICAMWH